MRISFLGTGQMGQRMCSRLLSAGYEVRIFNRTKLKMIPLIEKGAIPCDSALEACENSDLVIAMVRDDRASSEIWNTNLLQIIKEKNPKVIIMECSTLSAGWTEELDTKLKALKIDFIACPVIGSLGPAEQGQLILLPGGDTEVIKTIEPVLAHLGSKTIHHRHSRDSAVAKLAVNFFFASQVNLLFESMKMLMNNSKLSKDQVMDLFQALPILSSPLVGLINLTRQENYNPTFPIELVSKDLGYFEHFNFNQSQKDLLGIVGDSFKQAIVKGNAKSNINSIWANDY